MTEINDVGSLESAVLVPEVPIEPEGEKQEHDNKLSELEPVQDVIEDDVEEESETDKRLKKLSGEARNARREARLLREENEVLKGQRTDAPDAEFERRVAEKAAQVAKQDAFNKHCDDIYKNGIKEFGSKFNESVQTLKETFGTGLPFTFIDAITEASDKPHKMLAYLGDNTDVLDRISVLPAHRLGAALAKLDAEINKPAPVKSISKAPAPIKPVSGNAKSEVTDDTMDLDAYIKKESAKRAKRYA